MRAYILPPVAADGSAAAGKLVADASRSSGKVTPVTAGPSSRHSRKQHLLTNWQNHSTQRI